MDRLVLGVLLLTLACTTRTRGQGDSAIRFNTTEEKEPGTLVGNIKSSGLLKYNDTVRNSLMFTFDTDQSDSSYFQIGPNTGVLRTRRRLDRDAWPKCTQQESCVLKLDVIVQTIQIYQIIKVEIGVVDINDNRPQFSEKVVHLFLPESSPVGTLLRIEAPYDPDSPQHGPNNYTLSPTSTIFNLRLPEEISVAEDIYVYTLQKLDYETQSSYVMQLNVTEGDIPTSNVSITLNITITDVNDNAPEFVENPYTASVVENAPINTKILQVSAYDPDTGSGGKVRYNLDQRSTDVFGDLFSINETTGWIKLLGPLDYEAATKYTLRVVASDLDATYRLSSQTTVNINILDQNDNVPTMHVTYLVDTTAQGHLSFPENQPAEYPVLFLRTGDQDSGNNGLVTCDASGSFLDISTEGKDRFIVATAAPLDRERNAQFTVNITCADQGNKPLSVTQTYRVELMDQNDNSPTFTQPTIFGLTDPHSPGTEVAKITAEDPDFGNNGTIRYSLGPSDNEGIFRMDAQNGAIYLADTFSSSDLQNVSDIQINVIATDQGVPQRSTSVDIYFIIVNEYSNPPSATKDRWTFSVPENSPNGTDIGLVEVMDKYKSHLSFISFEIEDDVASSLPFSITSGSGNLHTRSPIDREWQAVYTFVVNIRYKEQAVHSSVTINVVVTDLNDNSPVIDYPNHLNYTVHISNKLPANSLIMQIAAHDIDSGENSQLTYKILAGGSRDMLKADAKNGSVYLTQAISDITFERIPFDITVEDSGLPTLSVSQRMTLVVNSSLPNPLETKHMSFGLLNEGNIPWVASLIAAAILLVIIIIVVVVVVRRQCATDKKCKNMEITLAKINNNTSMDSDMMGHVSPMCSGRGSDDGDSYRHRTPTTFEGLLRNSHLQVPYPAASDADSDSMSTDLSNTDSGRGSINRGQTDTSQTMAPSLCHTYIPEEGAYVPDLAYRAAPRQSLTDRMRTSDFQRQYPRKTEGVDYSRRLQLPLSAEPRPQITDYYEPHQGLPDIGSRYGASNDIIYSQMANNGISGERRSYEDLHGARPVEYFHHPRGWPDTVAGQQPISDFGSVGGLRGVPGYPLPGPYYRHSMDIVDNGRHVDNIDDSQISGSDGKLSKYSKYRNSRVSPAYMHSTNIQAPTSNTNIYPQTVQRNPVSTFQNKGTPREQYFDRHSRNLHHVRKQGLVRPTMTTGRHNGNGHTPTKSNSPAPQTVTVVNLDNVKTDDTNTNHKYNGRCVQAVEEVTMEEAQV